MVSTVREPVFMSSSLHQDFGHKVFHEKLNIQRKELETCLVAVEQRGYELMLAAQNALWVLDR